MASGGKNALQLLRQIVQHGTHSPGFEECLRKIRVLSGGNGSCVCELTLTEEHQNRGGTLHGGLTATLVDAVSTWALLTTDRGQPGVSVDLSVSYMKAVKVGEDIIIDAKTLRQGKTLSFLTVDITNKNGALLAQGKHTKFVGRL
ncbi:hypothetical protein ScPMuIL_005433 [Solemya velum]